MEQLDQAIDVSISTIKMLIIPIFTAIVVIDTIVGVVSTPVLSPFIATTALACAVFALKDLEKVLGGKLNKATNLLLPLVKLQCLLSARYLVFRRYKWNLF